LRSSGGLSFVRLFLAYALAQEDDHQRHRVAGRILHRVAVVAAITPARRAGRAELDAGEGVCTLGAFADSVVERRIVAAIVGVERLVEEAGLARVDADVDIQLLEALQAIELGHVHLGAIQSNRDVGDTPGVFLLVHGQALQLAPQAPRDVELRRLARELGVVIHHLLRPVALVIVGQVQQVSFLAFGHVQDRLDDVDPVVLCAQFDRVQRVADVGVPSPVGHGMGACAPRRLAVARIGDLQGVRRHGELALKRATGDGGDVHVLLSGCWICPPGP
jgi:hypothetical protein